VARIDVLDPFHSQPSWLRRLTGRRNSLETRLKDAHLAWSHLVLTPFHVMTWRNRMGQNEAVSLVKATCGIHLQNGKSQHNLCRSCVVDHALQQIAAEALVLVSRQQIKLVKEPAIRTAMDADYADVAPRKSDDLVEMEIEIGTSSFPTSLPRSLSCRLPSRAEQKLHRREWQRAEQSVPWLA